MSGRDPGGSTGKDGRSQAEEHQRSKDRYHAVIETAEHNTSPKQPPGVKKSSLVLHVAAHGRFDSRPTKKTIRAARDHGDLLAWRDQDGTLRYTPKEPDALRRLLDDVELGEEAANQIEAELRELVQ